jgi:hypothetical protein
MISTETAGQKELLPFHANKWAGGDGYGTPENRHRCVSWMAPWGARPH